jgi:hypothetical protein
VSNSKIIVKFLGLGLSRNILFTANSKGPFSKWLLFAMKEVAMLISSLFKRLYALYSHGCVLKLLNLVSLSILKLYTVTIENSRVLG